MSAETLTNSPTSEFQLWTPRRLGNKALWLPKESLRTKGPLFTPITEESAITIVELAPTPEGKLFQQKARSFYDLLPLPSRAAPILHGLCVEAGFNNTKSIDTRFNLKGMLTKENWERIQKSAVLMISAMSRHIPQSYELAKIYKELNPNGIVIMGGMHASARPEECLENEADIVVVGEAENTLPELLKALKESGDPRGVKGTVYKRGDLIECEAARPLLTRYDLSKHVERIHSPEVLKHVKAQTLETSRGCPYGCNFCCVTEFYHGKYIRKSNEAILEEAAGMNGQQVFFIADNFAEHLLKTIELLEEMRKRGIKFKNSFAQVRIESAFNEQFRKLLLQVGINTLYIGIESIDQKTLNSFNKGQTVEQIEEGVRLFSQDGIWVHGMFIIGTDLDTPEIRAKTVEWAKSHVDSAPFYHIVPLVGTPFEKQMMKEGRILTDKYHYQDAQHVTVVPENFTPYESLVSGIKMYEDFYSLKELGGARRKEGKNDFAFLLRDSVFRVFAKWAIYTAQHEPGAKEYINALKNWKPGQVI